MEKYKIKRRYALKTVKRVIVEKVSSREFLSIATVDQIHYYMGKLEEQDFINCFLTDDDLKLKSIEILPTVRFQMFFYFVLQAYLTGINWPDEKIWDMEDVETVELINKFKELTEQDPTVQISEISPFDVLQKYVITSKENII